MVFPSFTERVFIGRDSEHTFNPFRIHSIHNRTLVGIGLSPNSTLRLWYEYTHIDLEKDYVECFIPTIGDFALENYGNSIVICYLTYTNETVPNIGDRAFETIGTGILFDSIHRNR